MHFFIILAGLAGLSQAGINCEGSFYCGNSNMGSLTDVINAAQGVDPNRWYQNGQLIVCIRKPTPKSQ